MEETCEEVTDINLKLKYLDESRGDDDRFEDLEDCDKSLELSDSNPRLWRLTEVDTSSDSDSLEWDDAELGLDNPLWHRHRSQINAFKLKELFGVLLRSVMELEMISRGQISWERWRYVTCDLYMCHNIVTEAYITSSGGDLSSDVSIIISSHIIYIIYIIYTDTEWETN